jgi:membrane associated rhomboid family serine protease
MRPPENWRAARVTLVIAAVTAAAWLIVAATALQGEAMIRGAFVPGFLGQELPFWRVPFALTPLTSTLLHGDALHLIFNMVFLLFCGRAIEPVLGRVGVVILYVVGAYAAAAAHFMVSPQDVVPAIGASGAISAVLGAYAMLFGRNKVKVANPTVALWLHALWLMAAWVVLQTIVGFLFSSVGVQVGVAAHIGGFIVGILLARPLLLFRYRRA